MKIRKKSLLTKLKHFVFPYISLLPPIKNYWSVHFNIDSGLGILNSRLISTDAPFIHILLFAVHYTTVIKTWQITYQRQKGRQLPASFQNLSFVFILKWKIEETWLYQLLNQQQWRYNWRPMFANILINLIDVSSIIIWKQEGNVERISCVWCYITLESFANL